MFYKVKLRDYIRVPPNLFELTTEEAILKRVKAKYDGYISKEFGVVIDISKVHDIREGVVIPGDGASYYETEFELLTFNPQLQEVITGKIKDIADFGAFITMGPIDGMIHISQTMDDFVSFAKDKTLAGKDTKRVLRVNDKCKARIIAVSFKEPTNPKIALTMRQPFLGRVDWIEEDSKPKEAPAEKPAKGKEAAKAKKEGKK